MGKPGAGSRRRAPAPVNPCRHRPPAPEELRLWTASSFGFPLTREHLERHQSDSAERGYRRILKAVAGDAMGDAVGHIELGANHPRNRSVRI